MTDRFKEQLQPIDLIIIEDSSVDAELVCDSLVEAGLKVAVRLVDNEPDFRAALSERLPEAILSDWTMPNFSGRRALAVAQEICPDVPLIFVSGTMSESYAFEAMKQGTRDYVFKNQLNHLGPAVQRALNEAAALLALRENENRLRTVVQTIPDLIWLKDSDGVYLTCNRMFERFYGVREEDIFGKTDYDFVDRELADSFRDNDCKAMAADKPRNNEEWVTFADDGHRALFDTIKTPMFDSQGKLVGVLGIARDITEHHNLELQLRHAQKMEAVGTLAGGIAHDFNNILNVIMGYGTMVLDTLAADNPSRQLMHEVMIAADRAANLTKRLLIFSRKQVVEVKRVNINELILGLQKMLLHFIRENIVFTLNLADMLFIVQADIGQLEQVLVNLASNAKDAIQGSGRLTISTEPAELDDDFVAVYGYGKPGKYVLIKVSDTGHGMDAEIQKKIFEPFFTTKGVGEGTGLGLAISYGIIKQHIGYIKVSSEPGQGTTFNIYLPLHEEAATSGCKTEEAVPVKGGKETILLAEDDTAMRKLTKIILESFGYSVVTAEDGDDAIAKFMEKKECIDLALLDMIMPKKNGKEVCEAIRNVCPEVKILITSGYTMDVISTAELTESGFAFINKPYQPTELLLKVREILDRDPAGDFVKETNP